jgi:hypothetical protein
MIPLAMASFTRARLTDSTPAYVDTLMRKGTGAQSWISSQSRLTNPLSETCNSAPWTLCPTSPRLNSSAGSPSVPPMSPLPRNHLLRASGKPLDHPHALTQRPSKQAKVSDSFTFSKSSDFGAVLVSEADVKLTYFSEDTVFRRWLKVNFQGLLQTFPQVFDRPEPVWIITKTYTTSKCSIACWSGSQRDVSLEFGINLAVEGEDVSASPEASNVKVKTSGTGWAHYGVNEVVGNPTVRSPF